MPPRKWADRAEQEELDPATLDGPRALPADVPQPETRASDPAAVEAALGAPGAPVGPSEAPKPRRKYRKRTKPGDAPLPPDPIVLARQAAEVREPLRLTFDLGFKMVASYRKFPGWALAPEEAGILADAWAPCLAPYMGVIGSAMPWVTAVVVSYGVVAPRMNAEAAAKGNPEPAPVVLQVPEGPSPDA